MDKCEKTTKPDNMSNSTLLCITLNVRGLHEFDKRSKLFQWLEEKSFDIIFLQETFCTPDFVACFNRHWKGKAYHATTNSSHSRGVSILIPSKRNIDVCNHYHTNDGRTLLLNVQINNEPYSLVNMYAPTNPTGRTDYLRNTKNWITQHSHTIDRLIAAGDLNCCDSQKDKSTQLKEHTGYFQDFKDYIKVKDVWRSSNPDAVQYTYTTSGENTQYGSRIDYILCSRLLIENVAYSEIIHAPISDHDAVVASFNTDHEKRGSGYWKLNTSVLCEEKYQNDIRDIIATTSMEYADMDKILVWELIKVRIREYSIQYCTLRNRSNNQLLKGLEYTINKIKQYMHQTDANKDILKGQKEVLEREMSFYLANKAKGAQIRSKAQWIEEGEKSTAYFLRLEKHHQVTNMIKTLYNNEGELVHGSENTLSIMKAFYEDLYRSRKPSTEAINSFLTNLRPDTTLDDRQQSICEGPIRENECEEALRFMKNDKSPGLDGIPSEFYKVFWPDIGHILTEAYNESYTAGTLSNTQRKSVISLFFKKGDRHDIRNYRPISLTNSDYKILAAVLARRLKIVLPSIINSDQTGFMEGRYIGCNVRMIEDIIEYAKEYKKGGALIMLDFEKAYDSLEWEFLQESLRFFNFGPSFRKWVTVLYNNSCTSLKNNNYHSDEFELSRGVRQGCPLSALLFTVAVETMAIQIRQNSRLRAFRYLPKQEKRSKLKHLSMQMIPRCY